MRRVRRFLALPAVKRHLLVQVMVLLWLTRFLLFAVQFQRTRRTLSWLVAALRHAFSTLDTDSADLVWAIETAIRQGPRSCLIEALAAQAFIELHGRQGSLVIGTRRNNSEELEAHAWLEQNGHTVVGAHNGGFSTIGRFERLGA